MSIKGRDLIQRDTFGNPHKNYEAKHVQVCTYAARAGFDTGVAISDTETKIEDVNNTATAGRQGDMWPELTPVYLDSGASPPNWVVWTNGNPIEGFKLSQEGLSQELYGRGRMFDANESLHRTLLEGQVDRDAVYLPPGQTQANLDAALATHCRGNNINVYNLPEASPFH